MMVIGFGASTLSSASNKDNKTNLEEEKEDVFVEEAQAETLVKNEVATISEEISDLKDVPLEDLKDLEETIQNPKNTKIISLSNVLKGFTIDTKALNLKKLRKQELAGSSKARAAEVITNIELNKRKYLTKGPGP